MVFSYKHESWRYHPWFKIRPHEIFPGIGYAVAIFGTYCAGEWVYYRFIHKPSHHGDHGHGEHHAEHH